MTNLLNLTLICYEIFEHNLAARVLNDILTYITPAEVLVFSDQKPTTPGARWVYAEPSTIRMEAHRALWHDAPKAVTTSHFLNVEWDSGLVDPTKWDDRYLNYDFVGAPWWNHDHPRVGNGGFSLRSTQMMRWVAKNLPLATPEDTVLCRSYRPKLEAQGFTWPDDLTAAHFSFEGTKPPFQTFGYHHIYSWPLLYSDEEIKERVALMTPYARRKKETKIFLQMCRGKDQSRELASDLANSLDQPFWPWFNSISDRLYLRDHTFRAIFEYLDKLLGPITIVETGCARREWSEGLSTVLFGRYAKSRPGSMVLSVDRNPEAVGFAWGLVKELPVEVAGEHSLNFLPRLAARGVKHVDLLYLDSMDVDANNPIPSAEHHLKEFFAARYLLKEGSLLVVDDSPKVNNVITWKGALVAECMKQHKLLFSEYQIGWIWSAPGESRGEGGAR